jgi:hypothetical protein
MRYYLLDVFGIRMARVENTIFISYRRSNFPWALAIYKDLSRKGYDVFLTSKVWQAATSKGLS